MPRYKKIYTDHALDYDKLVTKEDFKGNLLVAIKSVCNLSGNSVVEFGAGTGRVTKLLATQVKKVKAFDAYPAMLELAEEKFREAGITNVSFEIAENKLLPVSESCFDLSIAGWTFGHCTSWYGENWQAEVDAAVREMFRVLKPTGTAIIFETLGTGQTSPAPPNAKLAQYYEFLEKEWNFSRSVIRTDYKFASLQEAEKLTKTFFGREYSFTLEANGEVILPECTGMWFRKKEVSA